ncbi:MAG: TraR/DksA C4-type zinc finger protein [Caldilinea sp.]|nr:TraR/DksA C4-type zinc finger protein [Caldilinea sp.]MDW8440708.1 TraR/DksA C4-type zinc finger protein [Caldilineaceae bacterium]
MKKTNAEFIEKERARLLNDMEQVTAELKNLRDLMQSEVDIEPDEGDAEVFEREKNAALIAVLERRLKDIETALKLIEKGEYGICTRCGRPIEQERLEIKPDATLCVECQREVERLNRRNRLQRQIEW